MCRGDLRRSKGCRESVSAVQIRYGLLCALAYRSVAHGRQLQRRAKLSHRGRGLPGHAPGEGLAQARETGGRRIALYHPPPPLNAPSHTGRSKPRLPVVDLANAVEPLWWYFGSTTANARF